MAQKNNTLSPLAKKVDAAFKAIAAVEYEPSSKASFHQMRICALLTIVLDYLPLMEKEKPISKSNEAPKEAES